MTNNIQNTLLCFIKIIYSTCISHKWYQIYKQYPCWTILLFFVLYETGYYQHNYFWYRPIYIKDNKSRMKPYISDIIRVQITKTKSTISNFFFYNIFKSSSFFIQLIHYRDTISHKYIWNDINIQLTRISYVSSSSLFTFIPFHVYFLLFWNLVFQTYYNNSIPEK